MATKMADMIVYEPGDWVRFYKGGQLVIGEVKYIRLYTMRTELCTDVGSVNAASVLEVRSAARPTE